MVLVVIRKDAFSADATLGAHELASAQPLTLPSPREAGRGWPKAG